MATPFATARERAIRSGSTSFTFNGKRYRTTVPGKDTGDLQGEANRPGSRITFPSATPSAPATTDDRQDRSRGSKAAPPRASVSQDDRQDRSRATDALRADRPASRPSTDDDRSDRARRSDAPIAEDRATRARSSQGEDTRTAGQRLTDFVTTGRPMLSDGDVKAYRGPIPQGRSAASNASLEKRGERSPDAKGKRESHGDKAKREAAKREQLASDRALQALDDAIETAKRSRNPILLEDLTDKRRRYLSDRYGL